MKHIAKALVLASAMAAAGVAHAEIAQATLVAGGPATGVLGYEMSNLRGGGELSFSGDLIGALSVAGVQTTLIGPATGTITPTAINIGAPILSLSGTFDTDAASFTATNVGTMGGATMATAAPNFATTGGSLSVQGISVDLGSKAIFANVSGANGVASQRMHVWTYSNIEGPVTFAAVDGTTTADNILTGLTITTDAFNTFAQALGLTAGGRGAMAAITDYGRMTAQILVDVKTPGVVVPEVPEPSTYLLMGLGLAGLAFASKRARRA